MQENYSTRGSGQSPQQNRKHKDSLFVDYFSKDRDWKQHFLSLYNALHGTNLQVETTKLERVNLEQVLYMDYYNDIAVMVNDQFIMMIEHQSTINPNMPLRLLEYVSRIYGNLVDSKSKFSEQLIPLAKPEFIVFYTGNKDIPPESCLYLSDAFKQNHAPDSEISLELKVKVCKIKGREQSPLVQSCSDLHEYVDLLDLIDEAKTTGKENPLTWAIQEAVRRNIMKDYLERKGGEVLSILTAEYDFDTAIAVKQEEAYASGLSVGREEGISLGMERGREEGISLGMERGREEGISLGMERGREEGISLGMERGREEGISIGAYETKLETAKKLLAMGLSVEQVAQGTDLPLETVKTLLNN